ncbi:AraC-like DNA-binding protein [Dysgonomonadaceae bacterium PH5-43]|nr:AraC-like DNA-binding protein [Dysgonomonadaceae bacterium PH5-43]
MIDNEIIESQLSQPVCFNAFVAVLVLSGNGEIQINYKSHHIEKEQIILLTVSHLFKFISYTSDLRCICLLVSKEFMEEMDATEMIYRRIRYGARNLLTHSKLSIQEIAAFLNFSDQASFGKFFKRKAGVSPVMFRNKDVRLG